MCLRHPDTILVSGPPGWGDPKPFSGWPGRRTRPGRAATGGCRSGPGPRPSSSWALGTRTSPASGPTRTGDRPGPETIPLARQLDQVCDRVEATWEAGEHPQIEDYLGELPETAWGVAPPPGGAEHGRSAS